MATLASRVFRPASFSYYRSLWKEGHNHRVPLTEEIVSRLVTLPLYPSLAMAQLDTVVSAIYAYFRQESHAPIKWPF